MIALYKKTENTWFKLPQKLRFLLVGGFNTVTSYLIFAGLYFLLDGNYVPTAIIQYIISVNISILTMRYYVFRSKGNFTKEYLKACIVYIYMLGFNLAWLYVFVDTLHINALISQAVYLVISTITTYILHKYFSFRKK